MKCAICGKENDANTRFCVHCGAALPAGAAGAAASPPASPPPVASAASRAVPPPLAPRSAGVSSGMPPRATGAPAYDTAPKTGGRAILILFVLGVVLVAAAVFGGMKAMKSMVPDQMAKLEPPSMPSMNTASAPSPASDNQSAAPQSDSSSTPPPSTDAPKTDATKTDATKTDADKGDAAKSEEMKAAPSPPPEPAAATPAPPPPPPKAAPKAPPKTATPKAAPAPKPATPVAAEPPQQMAAAAPAPPPARDRWAQMRDDLAQCKTQDLFHRLACDQKTRQRYCDGFWGKVPECPAQTTIERGQ